MTVGGREKLQRHRPLEGQPARVGWNWTKKGKEGRREHALEGALPQCPSLCLHAIGPQGVGMLAYAHVHPGLVTFRQNIMQAPAFPVSAVVYSGHVKHAALC